jgi:hypothetical protein
MNRRIWMDRWQLLGACVLTAFSMAAWPQERSPNSGMLYDLERASSLTYNCGLVAADTLQCDLFQTTTRKRFSEAAAAAEVAKARQEFDRKTKWPDILCASYQEDLDVVEGRKQAKSGSELTALTADEKSFMKQWLGAWIIFCKQPTAENWVRPIQIEGSRKARTCTVTQRGYSQRFRWIKGPTHERSAWVALPEESDPERKDAGDSCGFVDLSRFELGRDANGKSSWKYIARRQITNPKGALSSGLSCGLMDTTEYVFGGKEGVSPMQCDFIRYSEL